MARASDGNFDGTTSQGGTYGYGTIFRITPNGAFTSLHSFQGTDGANPYAPLVQGADGNLYGTTYTTGPNFPGFAGTVFRITLDGELTTLHRFIATEGAGPFGLMRANDGAFYGTIGLGSAYGYGSIYKVSMDGTLTIVKAFQPGDGYAPEGVLLQTADGNIYGTTEQGGNYGAGTIFRLNVSGELTTLHSFSGSDGNRPTGVLVLGGDGLLYGTTEDGGSNNFGTVFSLPVEVFPDRARR